jgi:hypothetical protein
LVQVPKLFLFLSHFAGLAADLLDLALDSVHVVDQ